MSSRRRAIRTRGAVRTISPPAPTDAVDGTIVTFYSYKGGTGRSMALANVAWILASSGRRVLVIDWDLEAPGLHRFFAPFLQDQQLEETPGLIDFVLNFALEAATPIRSTSGDDARDEGRPPPGDDGDRRWFEPYANIVPYARPLAYPFPDKGALDFVPAGQQGASYAAKVGAFDWGGFYSKMGGGVFLESVKRRMRKDYDYILIDSRTGVSDTSGICTVQMPDVLVVCFTASNQSIEGAAGIARSVLPQWEAAPTRQRPPRILPVLTRVDDFESAKLARRQSLARRVFEPVLKPTIAIPSDRTRYWRETEVPYKPFYCYEEVLAAFADEPGKPNSLLAAMERLTSQITEGEVVGLNAPPGPESRRKILALYEGAPEAIIPTNTHDLYISYRHTDRPVVEELARKLAGHGLTVWIDFFSIRPGDKWWDKINEARSRVATALICIGPGGIGERQRDDIYSIADRARSDPGFRAIPVLLPGSNFELIPPSLRVIQGVRFRETINEETTIDSLVAAIRGSDTATTAPPGVIWGENPYRGMEPFTEATRAHFFGRDEEVDAVLSRIRRAASKPGGPRLVVIEGPSGIGKTSLVLAGIIPPLLEDALSGGNWPIILDRPGAYPLTSLATACLKASGKPMDSERVGEFVEAMRNHADALGEAIANLLADGPSDGYAIVLIDQFEEVFTVCSDEAQRSAFIRNLHRAATMTSGQTTVVLTTRSDSLEQWSNYPELWDELRHGSPHIEVGPMGRDALDAAIVRPAQMVGCEVEPGLAEILADDSEDQPGALPLLQAMLGELWRRRDGRRLTVAAYRELGGLQGVIGRMANEAFGHFTGEDQDVCRHICLRLIRPGAEGEFHRKRVRVSQLLTGRSDRFSTPRITDVVARLANSRLLTVSKWGDQINSETSVELAHDALISAWPTLNRWLEENPERFRVLHLLIDAVEEWNDNRRNPDFLPLGRKRAEFNNLAASDWVTLNRFESAFLRDSLIHDRNSGEELIRKSERMRNTFRLLRYMTLALTLALVAITILFGFYGYQAHNRYLSSRDREIVIAGELKRSNQQFQDQIRKASDEVSDMRRSQSLLEVRILAAESASARWRNDRTLALLLAVEALDAMGKDEPRTVAAEQALRDALGNSGSRQLGRIDPEPVKTATGGRYPPLDVSRDGRWLATAHDTGPGRTVQLYDLTVENPAASPLSLQGREAPISSVSLSSDGRFVVAGHSDGSVDVGTRDQPGVMQPLDRFPAGVLATAIDDNSRLIVLATSGDARMWNLLDPQVVPTVSPTPAVEGTGVAAIIPRRRLIATGTRGPNVYLRSLTPEPAPRVLERTDGVVSQIAASLPGRWLITAGEKSAQLWDLSAPNPSAAWVALGGQRGTITAVSLRDDERRAVLGESEGRIQLWDLNEGTPKSLPAVSINPFSYSVRDARFSPDGGRLAAASGLSVSLMDVSNSGELSQAIELGGKEVVSRVAFAGDSRWLISAGSEYRLWPLRIDDLRKLASQEAGRNLSARDWDRYFPGKPYRRTFPDLPNPAE